MVGARSFKHQPDFFYNPTEMNTTALWHKLALFVALTTCMPALFAQHGSFEGFLKPKEGFKVEPYVMLQLWSTYSMGHELYNTNTKHYEPVDDRLNFLFRRARVGFKMQPYENLRFNAVLAYDATGRDVHAGTVGATNNGGTPSVGIFDAYMEWRIKPKSEKFYLVAGFFRPQLSRESITTAWQTSSMEKSATQTYVRQHTTGVGPGRVVGVNLGGLLKSESEKVVLNYNLGVFNPSYTSNSGNSAGTQFAPLIAGRAVLSLGDPEMKQYGIAYNMNYFNQRKGISIALSGSRQGKTDVFQHAATVGTDLLFNYDHLNFTAEYHQLYRQGHRNDSGEQPKTFNYISRVGHARAGYNLAAGKKYFIEPSLMYMHFAGAKDAEGQANAALVKASSGTESAYDAGINWYLNEKKLKVLLHYTWRAGDPGAAGDGAMVNEYFYQSGVGAIRRGNWIGLGINAIF